MEQRVYVVTGYELGWDCVAGVFDASVVDYDDLLKVYPESDFYINEKTIRTNAIID